MIDFDRLLHQIQVEILIKEHSEAGNYSLSYDDLAVVEPIRETAFGNLEVGEDNAT